MIFLHLGLSLLILKLNKLKFTKRANYLPSGSDNKGELGLGLNEDVTGGFGVSLFLDDIQFGGCVLLGVLNGVGSSEHSLFAAVLLVGFTLSFERSEELGVSGLFL